MLDLSLIKSIIDKVPLFIKSIFIENKQIIIETNSDKLFNLIFFLKNHVDSQFKILIDITSVDYPVKIPRFTVFYQFISIQYNQRLMVKVFTDGINPLASLSILYNSSNWLEREVWDMFGIFFSDHPDLRRILTDYGFQGFPMRKDFPLSGFIEVPYDDELKKVIYLPLELTQEFRFFDFQSPWQ